MARNEQTGGFAVFKDTPTQYARHMECVDAADGIRPASGWAMCKAGHELSPDNIVFAKQGSDAKERARCRLCRNASVQRHRDRARGEDVPLLKAFSPRLHTTKQVEPPAAQTVSLFTVLPPDFRSRLAGELMAKAADPLQLTYLKKASEERVWTGTSEEYAISLYVQALIDLTADAHSPLLRVDRLMAVILRP